MVPEKGGGGDSAPHNATGVGWRISPSLEVSSVVILHVPLMHKNIPCIKLIKIVVYERKLESSTDAFLKRILR